MNRNYLIVGGVVLIAVAVIAYVAGTRKTTGSGQYKSNGSGESYSKQVNYSAPQIDFNEIIADLEKQAAANPKDALIQARLGDAYFAQRKFDTALPYYKRAIQLEPADINSYNSVALSYHYLGNSPEGLKYADMGISKKGDYQRIWLTKGFILKWGMGDNKGAVEAWNKAIALGPNTDIASAAKKYIADAKGASKAVK